MSILIKGVDMPTVHTGEAVIRIKLDGSVIATNTGMVGQIYAKAIQMIDGEDVYKENIHIRNRVFDVHFTNGDCPYECEEEERRRNEIQSRRHSENC